MHDKLNGDEEEKVRTDDNKRKKRECGGLDNEEKEQLNKYGNRKKEKCDKVDDDRKEQLRKCEKKGMRDQRLQTLEERSSIFNNNQMCSMDDPSILTKSAFRLIKEDFKGTIQEGPTYICDIF